MKTSNLSQLKTELSLGKNTCLKEIFDNYASYCIGSLIKKTGCSEADAEDLLMDSILNFREKIISGQIEYLTNIKAYLFSTCYRMWLAKYHQEKTRSSQSEDIINELYDKHNDSFEKEEKLKIGMEALNRLGKRCQEIIKLFYVHNKSMSDIAEIMNFADGNVAKTTKSRCFKKLLEEVNRLQESVKTDG
ncbi:MAG: sigma-70 family RNA polymerase sigma factor [Reichenbachiella sp.]|uniref:RNA polymerase sigma factor n=1 Tax=Reichenbachiella sp. TaxID=2184521 RepID=UPI00296608FE|nr:sigma-70 family RNA polymerase sigma factor [Reichenbachiella sp.]MDW3210927.1 sigma-70 family RNA polymerase sigma factor [Reichenbachiella sp.]